MLFFYRHGSRSNPTRTTPHRGEQLQRPGLAVMDGLQRPSSELRGRRTGETDTGMERGNGCNNRRGDREHRPKSAKRVNSHQG